MKLTTKQDRAYNNCLDAIFNGKNYSIGGYAGTGKTTILAHISQYLPYAAVCACTGKAASVLRKKGIDANTIHSRIYRWDQSYEEFILLDPEDVPYQAFLIDEASMVGKDLWEDLCSFNVPIATIGDPGQLEPIGSSDINLMSSPDTILTEIHRQALGNPIIAFSQAIRRQPMEDLTPKELADFMDTCDDRLEFTTDSVYKDSIDWADIIICGFHKTRVAVNREKRHILGFPKNELAKGDRIICLQNDRNLGVFNGLSFTVESCMERTNDYDCVLLDDNDHHRRLFVSKMGFNKKPKDLTFDQTGELRGQAILADYGYAITCHKAQGSEWDKVAVIRETCDIWDQQRWDYTAITRASEELRIHI